MSDYHPPPPVLTAYTPARLYADEDVEEEVVEWFRSEGVNIKSARELSGHRGTPDEFHAAYAYKDKRFLLTKNTKDFYSDQQLQRHKLCGLICIEGSMAQMERFAMAAQNVLRMIVPYGDIYQGAKIIITADTATSRCVPTRAR